MKHLKRASGSSSKANEALALSPAAEADIDQIRDYTAATWGTDQADTYTDDIRTAYVRLASGFAKGRLVDIRPGYLKQSVGAHMIYYRDHANRIEIMRILHQKQDVSRNLSS